MGPQGTGQIDYLSRFAEVYCHDPAVALLRATEAQLVGGTPLLRPLLDLGSGDGNFLDVVRPGLGAVALDRNRRRARKAAGGSAYGAGVAGEAGSLPFLDRSFATILANSSLEHMQGLDAVLAELRRVLRDDGRLVLTVHGDSFSTRMWFWPRLLRALRLGGWVESYRRLRLRRLAIRNLFSADHWRQLLERAGFELEERREYMAPAADRSFERDLVLARFGLWKAHLSGLTRVLLGACRLLRLQAPRRVLASLQERRLRGVYDASIGSGGTALFLVARAVPVAVSLASAPSSVVERSVLAAPASLAASRRDLGPEGAI